ncbi:TolC family protein [Chitinimonas koreensis]|uniref:TolC family protein n=1 Tax=Chitinimonas koreensis TaxID=356302 RepID=UPI0004249C99|nr:TolC family protein [Chitinimonas koreensis]QNM97038.1 TolC family protein [Chitinimonas koreensis]
MTKRPIKLLPLAIAAAFVTGCAVQPKPIELAERQSTLEEDRAVMFGQQEAVNGAIGLEQAMARALKYNLDFRVKLMEEALAQRQLDLTSMDMLPKLALGAGYSSRSNESASSSEDVVTHRQSLVPSISSERERGNADLTLSWNVLDFGVSYYGAQQQADRLLILQERKRKVAHQLMQQVRQAYWQAVGAQQLEGPVEALLKDAEAALADSRKVEQEKLRAPLEALNYQRQLLDVIRQMALIRSSLAQAKPRLATIMNLAPGSRFSVGTPAKLETPPLGVPLEKMEELALLNRPELMEARYNQRISTLETKKAMAKLMPGLEFSIGEHYDSNKFLVNQAWGDAGVRVSWNLLNLVNAGKIRGSAEAQLKVAQEQRMALNMAVLTQVHVAYIDYQGRARQYELERDLNTVEQRILDQTRNAAQSSAQGKLQAILAGANAVLSQLRLYQSYGELQNAYGQIGATLGLDPLPGEANGYDLASLSLAFEGAEARWQGTVGGKQ